MFLAGAIQASGFFLTVFPLSTPTTPIEAVIKWWPSRDHSIFAYSVVSCFSLPYLNGVLIAIVALLLWRRAHTWVSHLLYVVCGGACVAVVSAAAVVLTGNNNTTFLPLFLLPLVITGWLMLRFKDERNIFRKAVWASISTMISNGLILFLLWNVLGARGNRGMPVGWYCGVVSIALIMALSCALFSDCGKVSLEEGQPVASHTRQNHLSGGNI